MSLHLYDTGARAVREFAPRVPGEVSLYLCGATVQAPPHIGHIRSGVNFDILRRWLLASGYAVTYCRNVTDIDDKIIHVAGHEGVPWWVVAERNQRAFSWAYDVLGCLPPTVEPRATGHVPEMITLIARLIEGGHAYPSGGDVYFDVRSFPDYGALSNQRPEHMLAAGDADGDSHKRDPRDFTLWKAAKPDEPYWDTPWGPGRPGWHLECSAMATRYLGASFDIHAGGVDLIFPHHENEVAQSQAAGDGFARYWAHNGLLTVRGDKMSKSTGNSLLVSELVKRVRPVELRYYLGQPHYRSVIDHSEEALDEAAAGYRRLEGFVVRAAEVVGAEDVQDAPLPVEFTDALDDDLAVPQALAAVHTSVREGNAALASGDKEALARNLTETRAMLAVLGLDPLSPPWAGGATGATGVAGTAASAAGSDLHVVLDQVVSLALEQRAAARSRKDFATADAIRDRLAEAGVAVEDTPQGTRWELRRE